MSNVSEKWKYKAEDAEKCPFCGSDSISVVHRDNRFLGETECGIKKLSMSAYCVCNKCHSRGKPIKYIGYQDAGIGYYDDDHLPVYSCGKKAVEAWNNRT